MKRIIIIICLIFTISACTSENEEIIISTRRPDDFMLQIPYEFSDHEDNTVYLEYLTENDFDVSFGIDVSSYNDEIHWAQITQTDIEFVFIRLGYRGYQTGLLNTDDFYYFNMDETEYYGIDNGIYFVTQAITEEEAIEEAEFILKRIKGYELELPIVIDIEAVNNEDNRISDLSIEERTDLLIILAKSLIDNNREVLIYTNSYFLENNLEEERLTEYDFWIADYSDFPDTDIEFRYWQYSDSGFVSGIYNDVDLNILINN